MPPPQLGFVFFKRVLRLARYTDPLVKKFDKLVVQVFGKTGRASSPLLRRQCVLVRLVIRGIDDTARSIRNPIRKGHRRMVQIKMCDRKAVDPDRSLHFDDFDIRIHVADGDGKIIGIHLHPHDLVERLVPSRRPINDNFVLPSVCRKEKWKSLNVIPMRVADENMYRDRRGRKFFLELDSEIMNSGPCIKDEDVALRPDFDARCISAILQRCGSGGGDGPARSPKSNVHRFSPNRMDIFSLAIWNNSSNSTGLITYASAPSSSALSISGLYDFEDVITIVVLSNAGILAELLADCKAVHSGHNEVEEDQLGFLRFGNCQSVKTVVGLEHGKPFFHEVMRVKTPQEIFVVNNKYFFVQNIPSNKCGILFAVFSTAKVWISLSKCNIAGAMAHAHRRKRIATPPTATQAPTIACQERCSL